jgi:hypothetical protein
MSAAHHRLKAVRTMLRDSSAELSDAERAVLDLRIDAIDVLCHALARDCFAIRERLKAEAEVGT